MLALGLCSGCGWLVGLAPPLLAPDAGAGAPEDAPSMPPQEDSAGDVPAVTPPENDAAADRNAAAGERCTTALSCPLGFCVDGRCCNEACDTPCRSCGSGTCTQVRSGPDPPQCTGASACDPLGGCVARPGSAPRLLRPWNGQTTGSHLQERARRPRFSWLPVTGTTAYELEVDDSCVSGAFQSCAFASPEIKTTIAAGTVYQPQSPLPVSTAPPVGRRYFWRMRACNAVGCSSWSPVRYVDVGRQTRDFNGDGYADALVGGLTEIWVMLGGAPVDDTIDLTRRFDGNVVVGAAGDVNGDGFGDMLVSFPLSERVFLLLGGPTLDAKEDAVFFGVASGQAFGAQATGVGDVNGDGYADVLVGAPGSETTAGRAYLFLGGATVDTVVDATFGIGRPGDTFASSLTWVGDTNADGYADLLIGGPGASVFLGGPSPRTTADFEENLASNTTVGAAGDLNGDGYADFVIGYLSDVFLGGPTIDHGPDIRLMIPSQRPERFFATGDLDNDGFADLIVGVPNDRAYVFTGGSLLDGKADLHFLGEMPDEIFGGAVSVVGDMNGDGFDDVVIGAGYNSGVAYASGRAYLFLGGAELNGQIHQRWSGKVAEDFLGASIAWRMPGRDRRSLRARLSP